MIELELMALTGVVVVNIVIVVRFFSAIEKRLTRMETIQDDVFRVRIKHIEEQLQGVMKKCAA